MMFNIDPLKEEENTCIVMGYITIVFSIFNMPKSAYVEKYIA